MVRLIWHVIVSVVGHIGDRHGFCRVILVAICRCIRAIVVSVWAIVEIIVLFDYFFFGRHFFCLLIFDELENIK